MAVTARTSAACVDVQLLDPTHFGVSTGPRAAWGYDLAGTGILVEWMHRHRNLLLAAAGAPVDRRPLRPHLTVAWQRGRNNADATNVEQLRSAVGTELSLTHAALYCRNPGTDGRRYRQLARHLLHR